MTETPAAILCRPAESEAVTRIYDFACVLRAADLMPHDDNEYFEKPWKWQPEYELYLAAGSPPIPDLISESAGKSPVNLDWQRFVRTATP